MADYYTGFSAEITRITPEEQSWIEERLRPASRSESLPPDGDEGDEEEGFAFAWEFVDAPGEDLRLWIFTRHGSGSLDDVGKFVREFLARFRPEESFGMTYANSCSSPRLDGFSGGVLIVTRDGYHIEDAGTWLERYRSGSRSDSRDRGSPAARGKGETPSLPRRMDEAKSADDFTGRARAALRALVRTVEATGGCTRYAGGETRPLGDEDWVDLGEAYLAACTVLGLAPMVAGGSEVEDGPAGPRTGREAVPEPSPGGHEAPVETASVPKLEALFQAADAHAAGASDPDHAVGDLQEILRTAWRVMTPAQRTDLCEQPELVELAELPEYGRLLRGR